MQKLLFKSVEVLISADATGGSDRVDWGKGRAAICGSRLQTQGLPRFGPLNRVRPTSCYLLLMMEIGLQGFDAQREA